ncbi:DUF5106 domain-containing protein [Pedobacter cryoconitis]|uniref:DUF5106 domain-containing protein n=1 Tax=Pedobacter cryoconitis TaxID=188932 RepID=A0A7X0J4I4_9SPHI|nr:DUF5106 domain-containing protein [Pedobacter cryoconitis]MBB6500983.1 hypothetical protein [Pedobacter cryoconitis]
MKICNQFLKVSFFVLTICCLSCQGTKEKRTTDKNKVLDKQRAVSRNFTNSKAKYNDRLSHYWDSFNFKNNLTGTQGELAEQAFVGYIVIFPYAPVSEVKKSIYSFLDKAKSQKVTFIFFKNLFDKYLYDPNSPMRNDLYYEIVLQYFLESDMVDNNEKIKYQLQLQIVRKNKPGSKANLFFYWLENGKRESLSEIKSPFTLLVFYEPGCSSCELAVRQLKKSLVINELIGKKMLKIIAIYPEGNEKIWKAYQPNLPSNWVNGLDRDRDILKKNIYDLKASPTIYLLDKNKLVLLKDVDFSQVEYFFKKIHSGIK